MQDLTLRQAFPGRFSECCTDVLPRLPIAQQLIHLLHLTLQRWWMIPSAEPVLLHSPPWTARDAAGSEFPPSQNRVREPKEAVRKAFDRRDLGIRRHRSWSK